MEELHVFLGWRQQQVVLEHTRIQSYSKYKSMTSANGGTYSGEYPCDGWADNLEPTLLKNIICFLIQAHNLIEPLIKQKVNYFVLIIELVIYFPNSLLT